MKLKSPEGFARDTRLNIPIKKRTTLRSIMEPGSSIGTTPLITIKEGYGHYRPPGVLSLLALRIKADQEHQNRKRYYLVEQAYQVPGSHTILSQPARLITFAEPGCPRISF